MSTAVATAAPLHEDFAALLDESFGNGNLQEGSVIKGTVVGMEKDLAVIDVGAKTEGRVPLREFAGPGRQNELKVGETFGVYLERAENALGKEDFSPERAPREHRWGGFTTALDSNER